MNFTGLRSPSGAGANQSCVSMKRLRPAGRQATTMAARSAKPSGADHLGDTIASRSPAARLVEQLSERERANRSPLASRPSQQSEREACELVHGNLTTWRENF